MCLLEYALTKLHLGTWTRPSPIQGVAKMPHSSLERGEMHLFSYDKNLLRINFTVFFPVGDAKVKFRDPLLGSHSL